MFELSHRLIGIYKTSNQTRSTWPLRRMKKIQPFPARHMHRQPRTGDDLTRRQRARRNSASNTLNSRYIDSASSSLSNMYLVVVVQQAIFV